MESILCEIIDATLMHYGMPKRSGRYPWGSGDVPFQHSKDFLNRVEELKAGGISEAQVAKELGLTTTQLRVQTSLAKEERRSLQVETAKGLREKGYSLNEIADKMGFKNDSSVRSLLDTESERRMNQAKATADLIKKNVNEKGMIDVGAGVEKELNISKEKLDQALYMLEREGYPIYGGRVPQATNPGKFTTISVICPPGTEHKEIYNYGDVHSLKDYISYDKGETYRKAFEYPASLDSSRLKIRYAEEGGLEKDGLMEIRRGCKDLDLGNSRYSQVRIMVDGTHYLKGMAVYSDDLPEGTDIIFNTNKHLGKPKMEVLKEIKPDPNNPFGSSIKEHGGQSYYEDPNGKYTNPVTGKKESLSLINKPREEGDWTDWGNKLPSQFLSKQNQSLIDKQLKLTIADSKAEYDEICNLTNPTVKKKLLSDFANNCDSAAVHLKAAALPRQHYQVLIPIPSLKDDEVYAPNYHNGEKVALIRYPHGGTFEIPILKVNNGNKEGVKVLGKNPVDAVGINAKNAGRLSGADFDGDTVMVIPCNSPRSKVRITSTHELEDLKGFEPKDIYGGKPEGTFKPMKATQKEMGVISNLITDMTLKGATEQELARAVKHSMVVIDAEKHHLDYKQSERDQGIAALKRKYQGTIDPVTGKYHEGAATLISRAKSEQSVLKRKGSPRINPDGSLSYQSVYEEYTDKDGKKHVRTQKSTKMAEVDDARDLISDLRSKPELAYADYANTMKQMAKDARKLMMNTGKIAYSAKAKRDYQTEVDSLNAKLKVSLMNAPRERRAQLIANSTVKAKMDDNPDMTKKEIKKAKAQALAAARVTVDAHRHPIDITDREWEAIQAGAISENTLTQILNHADEKVVRQKATPRTVNKMSDAKTNRAKAMRNSGYTNAEIAEALGVSTSTITKAIHGEE